MPGLFIFFILTVMKKVCIVLIVAASLAGCGGEAKKKVMVLGRGELTATGTTIIMKEGPGHAEQVIEVDKGATELTVDVGGGSKSIKIPGDQGYYVLNLKKDTIVGSKQEIGADLSRGGVISQESLQGMIDSMQQLTVGANIKEGKTLIVFPMEAKKVSSNDDARVFGPFTGIPSTMDAGKDGKAPDIFKLFTNTQMRERIANFKKATVNLEQK